MSGELSYGRAKNWKSEPKFSINNAPYNSATADNFPLTFPLWAIVRAAAGGTEVTHTHTIRQIMMETSTNAYIPQ